MPDALGRAAVAVQRRPPCVAVVGSVNLDFIVGVSSMPDRGETVSGGSLSVLPGGKGANQAVQAALLGAEVSLVARVGTTALAPMALETLTATGVDLTHVGRDANLETGLAFVLVEDSGDNRIVVAPRANAALAAEHVESAAEVIRAADVLLMQLEVPDEAIEAAVRVAADSDTKVVLNPAPARALAPELLRQVDYLVPNETEAASLSGVPVTDTASAVEAARELLGRGVGNVVVTLGERGAVAVGDYEPVYVDAAPVDKVVDTTGAGDAFCAAFTVGIAAGLELADCLTLGTAAGSHAVARTGAQASMGTLAELSVE